MGRGGKRRKQPVHKATTSKSQHSEALPEVSHHPPKDEDTRNDAKASLSSRDKTVAASLPSGTAPRRRPRPLHMYRSYQDQIDSNAAKTSAGARGGVCAVFSHGRMIVDSDIDTTSEGEIATNTPKYGPLSLIARFRRWNEALCTVGELDLANPVGLEWYGRSRGSWQFAPGAEKLSGGSIDQQLSSFHEYVAAHSRFCKEALQENQKAWFGLKVAATVTRGLREREQTTAAQKASRNFARRQTDVENTSAFLEHGLLEYGRLRTAMEEWAERAKLSLIECVSRLEGNEVELSAATALARVYLSNLQRSLIQAQSEVVFFKEATNRAADEFHKEMGFPPEIGVTRLIANAPGGASRVLEECSAEAEASCIESEEILSVVLSKSDPKTVVALFKKARMITIPSHDDASGPEGGLAMGPSLDRTFFRIEVHDRGFRVMDYDGMPAILPGVPEDLPLGYMVEKDGKCDLASSLDFLAAKMGWGDHVREMYHQDWLTPWEGQPLAQEVTEIINRFPFGQVVNHPLDHGGAFLRASQSWTQSLKQCDTDLQDATARKAYDEQAMLQERKNVLTRAKHSSLAAKQLLTEVSSACASLSAARRRTAEDRLGPLTAEEGKWLEAATYGVEISVRDAMDDLRIAAHIFDPQTLADLTIGIEIARERRIKILKGKRRKILQDLYPSGAWTEDFEQWLNERKSCDRPISQSKTTGTGPRSSQSLSRKAFREKYRGISNTRSKEAVEVAQQAWIRSGKMPSTAGMYNNTLDGGRRDIAIEVTDFETGESVTGWSVKDKRWVSAIAVQPFEPRSQSTPAKTKRFHASYTRMKGTKIGWGVEENNIHRSTSLGGTREDKVRAATRSEHDTAMDSLRNTLMNKLAMSSEDVELYMTQLGSRKGVLTWTSATGGGRYDDKMVIGHSKIQSASEDV